MGGTTGRGITRLHPAPGFDLRRARIQGTESRHGVEPDGVQCPSTTARFAMSARPSGQGGCDTSADRRSIPSVNQHGIDAVRVRRRNPQWCGGGSRADGRTASSSTLGSARTIRRRARAGVRRSHPPNHPDGEHGTATSSPAAARTIRSPTAPTRQYRTRRTAPGRPRSQPLRSVHRECAATEPADSALWKSCRILRNPAVRCAFCA